MKRRMKTSLFISLILGIICVLGFIFREGFTNNFYFILALFYNRLLMGFVIGLLPNEKRILVLLRGAFIGLVVAFAFYLSTYFHDPVSLFAGIIYGLIIDAFASKYSNVFTRGVQKIINKVFK